MAGAFLYACLSKSSGESNRKKKGKSAFFKDNLGSIYGADI